MIEKMLYTDTDKSNIVLRKAANGYEKRRISSAGIQSSGTRTVGSVGDTAAPVRVPVLENREVAAQDSMSVFEI